MHKIIILGPQGSGKGTQAKILGETLRIPALSMGQMLRKEKQSGSEEGLKIGRIIDSGQLVPDTLTSAVLKKRLTQEDTNSGFVLDGFPRFMEQYESSKSFLQPTAVLVVTVPEEESIKRLMSRAKEEGRIDDSLEKIKTRLAWSREETEPVIAEYSREGIVHTIDGLGSIEEVRARIAKVLGL